MKIKFSKSIAHIFMLSVICFVHIQIKAQSPGSIQISTIPHELFWENTPVKYAAKGNQLMIEAGPKMDMFRDPNVTYNTDNAPKLVFKADENFILTVAIEHAFDSKWDGGAIIFRQGSLNWI